MGSWGKHNKEDELILQRYISGSWEFVEVVGVNGAARKCSTMARRTGIKHRVWNTGKNELYCESG